MKHLFLISGLLAFGSISLAHAANKTIDCTVKTVQRKHAKLCKSVIDPSKYQHAEFSTVDCTGELEDGYAVNLCKKVDPKEQKRLRKEHSKK